MQKTFFVSVELETLFDRQDDGSPFLGIISSGCPLKSWLRKWWIPEAMMRASDKCMSKRSEIVHSGVGARSKPSFLVPLDLPGVSSVVDRIVPSRPHYQRPSAVQPLIPPHCPRSHGDTLDT